MAVSLTHTFVSAIPDGADTSVVRPSNWNAEHTLTGTVNTLMGFDATGASQSVTVGSGLTYSAGTITATGDGSGTVTSVAALTLGTSGTDLTSTVANGTTTPVITLNVPTASATNRGVLSSTDWTTFNNKGSGTITSVTATAPVVSTGGTTPVISMAAATASVNGYLTSADWTTFNNKGSGTVTSVTGTSPVVSSGGTTPAISMPAATTSVNGYLTSTDWTTFNNKGSGSVTSVSGSGGTTGLTLTGGPITTTGTLTLGGTLAAANGGTGITSLGTGVATFLGTPSSANLAAAVTDETGSGALVFGTTPTFTTNITAPLVIGGTAVSSSLTLQSTSGVGSSDFMAFQTGSQSERMRITTAGNVGIGTTSPLVKLSISNNVAAPPAISFAGTALQLSGVDGTNNRLWMEAFAASDNITFRRANGTAASPTAILNGDIFGFLSSSGYGATGYATGASAQIRFLATENFTDSARGGSIDFFTVPNGGTTLTQRMIIDQSGNVGIGNSSPSTTLDVTGTLRVSGAVTFTTALTTANGGIGTSTGSLANCTVDGTNAVGYLTIPQNAQTGSYTLVLADSGKSIYHAAAAAAATYTIPANGSVAYALGTTVTFINMSANNVTIAITTDTLYFAGAGTTGSRTLAQYGVATATKMTSTTWIISGLGLT